MILNTQDAKITHLLRRTHFAVTNKRVAEVRSLTIPQLVDQLLHAPLPSPSPPPHLDKRGDVKTLIDWWLDTMIHTPNPLQEKMTLFWHGHFTSSVRKVKDANLIAQQNVLLRKFALGNFREFTYEVSIDPAMLIYLDNNTNQKQSPNENYARELMELFTLGIGSYTERDVKEVARALTGWKVRKENHQAVFLRRLHDEGNKTIFGKTDTFDTRKTTDWIVAQPACATFLATTLWSAFAYPHPEPHVIQPIAQAFIDSGYEIKALLRAMFTADEFYSDQAYRALVLSPIEYIVGLLTLFPTIKLTEQKQMPALLKEMGQIPFDPPNVAGWPGGAAWLSSSLLFGRFQFAELLVEKLTEHDFALNTTQSPTALLQDVLARIGLSDLSTQTRAEIASYVQKSSLAQQDTLLHGVLHLLFISPEAQVH